MNKNTLTIWEEKNSIEPKMKLENNGITDPKNIINETNYESEKNEWKNIGNKKKVNYIGNKFGSLIIIKQYNGFSPCGSKIIKVDYTCNCGHMGINKRIGSVKRQSMCIYCKKKNEFKVKEIGRSAFNNLYNDYRTGAKSKNREFKLTPNEFELLTKNNCYYCGEIPSNIKHARNRTEIYIYNGIDRKDNNKGYISENVVSCCKRCNFMKLKLSDLDFINHIKKIYEYQSKFVENK